MFDVRIFGLASFKALLRFFSFPQIGPEGVSSTYQWANAQVLELREALDLDLGDQVLVMGGSHSAPELHAP